MNRVCYVTNMQGDLLQVLSDEPIRFLVITEDLPRDRVFELTQNAGVLRFGSDNVSACLRDDLVGHISDDLKEEQPRD